MVRHDGLAAGVGHVALQALLRELVGAAQKQTDLNRDEVNSVIFRVNFQDANVGIPR